MTPPFVDGSRLQAVVQDAGNGAVAFEHWQDSQLGGPCQFVPTTDGKYHCAPIQNNTIAYSDTSCTMKVAVLSTCGAMIPYVVDQQTGSCEQAISQVSHGAPATIYSIGANIGSGQVYALQGEPPTCVATTSLDYYQIAVADLSQFVGATLKQEARGPRLAAELLECDDGSKQITGQMYDLKMGDEACTLDASGDPQDPNFFCIPGAVAQVQPNEAYFDNPTCKTSVAEEYGSNGTMCPPAKVVVSYPANQTTCDLGTATFYATGTDVTAGNICSLDAASGSCNCHTDTSGDRYYTLGAKLDPSTFAPMGFAKIGTGRLRALALTTTAGELLTPGLPGGFWDTMSGGSGGESCQVKMFSDMTLRCVPQSALFYYSDNSPYYADSSCTQQVFPQYTDPGCPTPAPSSIVMVTPAADACSQDTVTAAYATGTAIPAGQMLYASPNCFSVTPDPSSIYYTLGSALDPSTTYASLAEKTE